MEEDEIDLRAYAHVLIRGWRLILALTMLGGVIAGGVSLLMPDTYEASALVSIAQPRYTLRLEGVSQGAPVPVKAYPDLALSDDVLGALLAEVKPDLPSRIDDIYQLKSALKATLAADPTLLRLVVSDQDPEHAARIANAWARLLVERAGQLYAQDNANLVTYQTQLEVTKDALDQAEQALAAFQTSNPVAILTAQLNSQQAILTDYLNRAHQFALLTIDAQDLRGRLARLDPATPAGLTDEVVVLMISTQALSNGIAPASSQPLQVVVGQSPASSGQSVAQQLVLVDDLIQTLLARAADARDQVEILQPQILATQGQVAEAQRRESELTRTRDLTKQQYLALAGKIEEAKIAVQETSNIVQVASQAARPTERVGPRRTQNMVIGAVAALVLSVLGVLGREWWKGGRSRV